MTTSALAPGSAAAPAVSDSLRTIAARLICSLDHVLDGRMILALAEAVSGMESRLADVDESEEEYLQAMNDFLNATQERVNAITARRKIAADGIGPNGPRETAGGKTKE